MCEGAQVKSGGKLKTWCIVDCNISSAGKTIILCNGNESACIVRVDQHS
jgi:hypothetical protein